MQKKRGRGRGRANGEGSEHDSLLQPCCIEGCDRYGTRLLSSLRDNYQLKDSHSGRVCEGHYRRDLRSFKRKHTISTPKKQTSSNSPLINSTRKHQVSSSSPPRVLDEPNNSLEPYIPHSYLSTYDKSFYSPNIRSGSSSSPWISIHQQYPLTTLESDSTEEEYEPPVDASTEANTSTTVEPKPFKYGASQIFMEVDDDCDDEDYEEMTIDEEPNIVPPLKIRKTVLPSISQLCSTPSPSSMYPDSYATYKPPPLQIHHCGYEPISQSTMHDTKFKAFCDFVLKSESYVI